MSTENSNTKILIATSVESSESPTKKPKVKNSRISSIVFALTAIQAEAKLALKRLRREFRYFFRFFDLAIIFSFLGIIVLSIFVATTFGIPIVLSFMPIGENPQQKMWGPLYCSQTLSTGKTIYGQCSQLPDNAPKNEYGPWPFSSGYVTNPSTNQTFPAYSGLSTWLLDFWLSDTIVRAALGAVGVIGIIFQLVARRDIEKFRDKVNNHKEITYVFGSTIYAEQFCQQMVFEYGFEEHIALISDSNFLWVENIAGLMDTFIIKNPDEFEKSNFYKVLTFKNAKRVMILTDNIGRNQAILTNVRAVRPDVPIFILSQYTPSFVENKLVEDTNLHVIEDLEATNEGLVKSLSLDITYPDCTEINVPRTFVGKTGEHITAESAGIEVLAIRRPDIDAGEGKWLLLPPTEKLQRTDRILCYSTSDFFMKQLNRIVDQLPIRPLVDLGELTIDGNKNKLTDLPGRKLLLEPMNSRRSWRRVFLTMFGIVFILSSAVINWIGKIPVLLLRTQADVDTWSTIIFFAGIILLLIAYWLHPIAERGIRIIDKDRNEYILKTKTFSLTGKDERYDLRKVANIYCIATKPLNPEKDASVNRKYLLQLKNNQKIDFVTITATNKEVKKKDFNKFLRRFEIRLESYMELPIKEITSVNDIPQITEMYPETVELTKSEEKKLPESNTEIAQG